MLFFLTSSSPAYAVKFDLIAPQPPANGFFRGQTVQFTINIDTRGRTVNSTEIGMTYNTQYLEYVSTNPGNAMTSSSTTNLGGGRLLFRGENPSGFSGQGTFAYVNFKIIAQAPGQTELCVLWNPQSQPTSSPQSTSSQPTSFLPRAGEIKGVYTNSFFGLILISIFLIFFWIKNLIK